MTLELAISCRQGLFLLDASFRAQAGITALFGPSGAGKSTLLNAISGLTTPAVGHIGLDGRVLFDSQRRINLPPHQRRVGYLFQDARLFPHLSVAQNLDYGRKLSAGPHYASVNDVVELLGIGPLLACRPTRLSGGEQQRVAIGRALLASPRLLLLDEPLTALDDARKDVILGYIRALQRRYALTLLYVTHDFREVARLADNLILLEQGKVIASGDLASVTADARTSPRLAQGPGVVLDARIHSHQEDDQLTLLAVGNNVLQLPKLSHPCGSPVRLHVLADDVALAVARPTGLSIRNQLPSHITQMQTEASRVLVTLEAQGTPLLARITCQAAREMELVIGQPVHALLKGVALADHSFTSTPDSPSFQ